MRIGVGTPPNSPPGSGAKAIINILKGEPWVGSKPDGRVVPRIATEWAWDESGTSLTLKLRRDVYFHDGTQLTPEIAAATLRKAAANDQSLGSVRAIKDVRTQGDDTIVIELSERNLLLLSDLTGIIVVKPENEDIGTGPFHVVARQDQEVQLSAFSRFYRGRPSLAGITVHNYPTQRNAWTALMRGEIDMLYEVSQDALDFVQAEKTVNTYTFLRPYYIPLVFNVDSPALRSPAVRQAINLALDRDTLVRDGMKGYAMAADNPFWPLHWAYGKPPVSFTFDPAAARSLLDAAGLTGKTSQRGPVPIRLSFSCMVFADDQRYQRLAVIAQKQLAEVGIEMRLVPESLQGLFQKVQKHQYDAFIVEMAGRSLSWVYEFWRTREGAPMATGYHGADREFDRMRTGSSDEEIKAAVADVVRKLHDDPPAAFLVWQKTSRAASSKFDVAPEENRDILSNLLLWRPAAAANASR